MNLAAIALGCLSTLGCGSTSPTTPSPQVVQVAGAWSYASTLTAASGGDCIGPTLQATAVGGVDRGTLQISQTEGALTATTTSDADGSTCSYAGTASATSITLTGTQCSDSPVPGATCSSGAIRDLRLQTLTLNATVSGSSLSGTTTESWSVTPGGGGTAFGSLTVTSNVTATKR